MKKAFLVIFAALLVAAGGFGAWYWVNHGDADMATLEADTESGSDTAPLAQPAPDASGNATYADPAYGFSITYPASYKIADVPSQQGDIYLIQNGQGTGMQLSVAPYNEGKPLTEAQIRQDLPDMPITNARAVTLPSGISAIAFNSSGGGFGDSIEVWFAHEGFIYQASTYAAQADLMQRVMGTFRF